MHPHDYLLAVVIALTQPVIYGISAPLGINGFLKRKLGYVFHFSNMEEARARGMNLPDGLVFNEHNKILLIPECKSSLQENGDTSRLIKQLQGYSSKEFLQTVRAIIPDFAESEIVIVTFPKIAKEIQLFVKAHSNDLESTLNTVIWAVSRIPKTDQLLTKLYYGRHIDKQLNAAMVKGVYCKPPAREFLSSPDIPDSRFASIIGRRLLVSIAVGTKTSNVARFLEENKDLAISFSRLRGIFAALFRLVPELGSYERKTGTIELRSRVEYSVVQSKLSEIGKMSRADYHRTLGEPAEKEAAMPIVESKPTKQVSLMGFIENSRDDARKPKAPQEE
jgi:hypothetical protein